MTTMTTQHIKLIVQQLVEATGHKSSNRIHEPELIHQDSIYKATELPVFIEELARYARLHDLTLVVNNLPEKDFRALLEQTEHPILYFEQQGAGLIPVIGGKNNQGEAISINITNNGQTATPNGSLNRPALFSNHPQQEKNGQVLFITTFPMEPLVSHEHNSHGPHEHLTPTKRLLKLLGNERKDIGYIYFYAIVVGLISLILPLGVSSIFGLVSSGMTFSSVYVLMGLVVGGLVLSGILQIIQVTLVEILQRRIFAKAAFEFSYRLPRVKTEAFADSNPPELMNRFFDVLTIQKTLPKFLIDITAAALQIVFGLLLLSFYHPFFIAFSLVIVFVFLVIVRINGSKGLETSIKESKYKYRVVAWLEDVASTLLPFKLAGTTSLPVQKMDVLVNNYLHYRTEHFKILKGFYYYALAFKTLVIGGLLILGTLLLVNREITLGEFVASEIVIVLLTGAVEKLFLSIDNIFDLLTAVDKIGHVTDLEMEKEGGFKFTPNQCAAGMAVKVRGLSYSYPNLSKKAIEDINLDFHAGESVCVTGQNGSGKHTLFKVLSGVATSYEGSVLYNGISMRDLDVTSLRSFIEMNFPNQEIFDGTILENLTMGRSGVTLEDVQRTLEKLHLTDEIAKLPDGLNTQMISGGKRMALSFVAKIALARCILTRPKLLLITDSLQDIERQERLRLIQNLTDPTNHWTLIVLSNDPAFMGACDRVVVMEQGKVVATGDYKSVLKRVAMYEN